MKSFQSLQFRGRITSQEKQRAWATANTIRCFLTTPREKPPECEVSPWGGGDEANSLLGKQFGIPGSLYPMTEDPLVCHAVIPDANNEDEGKTIYRNQKNIPRTEFSPCPLTRQILCKVSKPRIVDGGSRNVSQVYLHRTTQSSIPFPKSKQGTSLGDSIWQCQHLNPNKTISWGAYFCRYFSKVFLSGFVVAASFLL